MLHLNLKRKNFKNASKMKRAAKKLAYALLVSVLGTAMGQIAFAQTPDWARDFYGNITFQLIDDPDYARQYTEIKNAETELKRIQNLTAQKQQLLTQKTALKQTKISDLQKTQDSITAKTTQKDNANKDIKIKNAEIDAFTNAISSNTNLIKVKQSELITQNNALTANKEGLAEADIDVAAKQSALDSALAACQAAGGTNCYDSDAYLAALKRLEKAKDTQKFHKEQVVRLQAIVDDMNGVINTANAAIASDTQSKATAEAKVVELTALVDKLTAEIPALNATASSLTDEVAVLTNEVNELTKDFNNYAALERQASISLNQMSNTFDVMRTNLINDLKAINQQGYSKSYTDGAQEGIEIASNVGSTRGQQDGVASGSKVGEKDGRTRDFQRGAQFGEQEGVRRGMEEGTATGKTDGRRDGYIDAGNKEGQASGIAKAEKSDAASVGSNEGRQAGIQRAASTGMSEGYKRGEQEAVSKMEAQSLSNVAVNGAFAGVFDYKGNMPQYPGSKHKYYNENVNHTRAVYRLAYTAGYRVGYDYSSEQTYNTNVEKIYTAAYNQYYKSSYDTAFAKYYEDSFIDGRETQEQVAYDREYKPSYAAAYKAEKAIALQSPDRSTAVYTNAFKVSETSAYQKRYGEIRQGAYDIAERDSYNQNIAGQIENYRAKRFNDVIAIYNNYPVVKFIGSSITDAGISGVAANDGVFQPSEKVAHDVTIANYASVAASGVKVIATNGQSVVLPSIPAKSVVTVKGALLDQIPATEKIGATFTTSLAAKFDLTANEKSIQGRYFANAASGILNSGNKIQVTLRYPMELTMKLNSPIIVGQTNGLSANVVNKSNRDYMGPIVLELSSSIGNSIFNTMFSEISMIDGSVTKSDATFRISDMSDIFTEINFSVLVKQNGVVIGELKNTASDYVKAPYISIEGAPVVLVKSTTRTSRQLYKDLVAELGGASNVSILDMASGSIAQSTLDNAREMANKTVYVINDSSDSLIATMNKLFTHKNVFVAFLSDGASAGSLAKAMGSLSTLKGATRFPLVTESGKVNLVSTAPILNSDLKSKVSAVEVAMRDLESVESIAAMMKLSDDELMKAVTSSVTLERYFSLDAQTKMIGKTLVMRTLEDIMAIAKGYEDNDNDRSFIKRIKNDKNLLMNKFKATVEDGSDTDRLASSVLAYALYNGTMKALEDVSPMNSVAGKVRRNAERDLDDMVKLFGSAKKVLKKNGGRDTVKKVEGMQENFYPF